MEKFLQSNSLLPEYRHRETGRTASRIDQLNIAPLSLDAVGVAAFLKNTIRASETCFSGITRRLPYLDHRAEKAPLKELLINRLSHYLDSLSNPIVALSGGLDSCLITSMIRDITGKFPVVATLVSGLPDYCERERTFSLAKALGIREILEIPVDSEDFVSALPDAINAAEVPLFNLHPVSKWLFAQRLRKLGFYECITGDGADQIFSGDPGTSYLPVVGSLFASSGIALACPFMDLRGCPLDPTKSALRKLAPPAFEDLPKHPCYTPPLDLSRYWVGKVPAHLSDREITLQTTLSLLKESHL